MDVYNWQFREQSFPLFSPSIKSVSLNTRISFPPRLLFLAMFHHPRYQQLSRRIQYSLTNHRSKSQNYANKKWIKKGGKSFPQGRARQGCHPQCSWRKSPHTAPHWFNEAAVEKRSLNHYQTGNSEIIKSWIQLQHKLSVLVWLQCKCSCSKIGQQPTLPHVFIVTAETKKGCMHIKNTLPSEEKEDDGKKRKCQGLETEELYQRLLDFFH